MKSAYTTLLAMLWLGAVTSSAQISNFQHVVVIVQENRTPDNLFQGLCVPPFGTATNCKSHPTLASRYNILTANWLDKHSPSGTT